MADLREGLDPLWGLLLTSWNRSMEAARKAPKTRKLYLDATTDTGQDPGVHHLGGGRAERADAGLQRQNLRREPLVRSEEPASTA
ncbi:hypothetical protein [Frankia sp. EAN1pec]|uniref:hypothetical protein n=1 Tax=Parafrankia sp. (strain EAN1pec) TaxID=298653 RepID=UPI0002DBEF35